MNYYFLTEDEKSLKIVLPIWLDYMNFGCKIEEKYQDLKGNNSYILESSHGIIALETQTIFNAIDTIKDNTKRVDKLVILLDAEEIGAETRKTRILNKINDKYDINTIPCEIKIFVCDKCFESWLLGCVGIYDNNKEIFSEVVHEFYNHFDIERNNPELMDKPDTGWENKSTAKYHFQYLHTLLNEVANKRKRKNYRYTKSKPGCVVEKDYFNGLVERINKTNDIARFKEFYNFIVSEGIINNSQKDTP